MRFSIACALGIASVLLGAFAAAPATAASDEEIEEIKQHIDEQERTIRALRDRVEELEAGAPETPPVSAEPEAPETGVAQEGAPSPIEDTEKKLGLGRPSPIVNRGNLDDRQTPAARPGDYTMDPQFRGFIPIPNTAVMVKFNAKPRVDFIGDTGNPGTDFRFVPALFPPTDDDPSQEDGWQFGANANGSQLIVDVQAPAVEGSPRFYYQNDFFGSNTSQMSYRLQHLYGEYAGFLAGFTYGVFEDPDAWPNTVDYEGPNAVIFARRAVAQYKREMFEDFVFTVSLENPDFFVDTTGDPDADQRSRAPDSGLAIEWTPGELGHLRASTIFRSIGVDGGTFGSEDVFGWGINASGNIHVTSRDDVQFYFVYGEGVGGMGNDTSFVDSDAAFKTSGDLEALQYWSAMIALTHEWTPRWSSTGTFGYVNLENTPLQLPNAYHATRYGSLNLQYRIFKRLRIGVEGLYGYKQVNDNQTNDIFRIQIGLAWALFD